MAKKTPRKPASKKPAARPAPAAAEFNLLDLLRELSNTSGVSGDEGAVRRLIRDAMARHVDEIKVDPLGNLLAVKKSGAARAARVMVAAHMDEVGFMVTGYDADGSLRFDPVGGIDERMWLGKAVLIGPKQLPGIIGVTPVHLLSNERRNTVVKQPQLRIDIGAESEAAAKKQVAVGERGTFASEFTVLGPSLRGKALDNRLGCAALVELLRGPAYSFDLYAAFTVQEEVGLRGAQPAAYALDPQCAFVLDCTAAYDMPTGNGQENTRYNSRLGLGPAIYIADAATLSDARLVRHLRQTAEAAGLPYQIRQPGPAATDAGAIHRVRAGIPSVSISVPTRYLHTPAALARQDDWRNLIRLMRLALEQWTPKIMKRKA